VRNPEGHGVQEGDVTPSAGRHSSGQFVDVDAKPVGLGVRRGRRSFSGRELNVELGSTVELRHHLCLLDSTIVRAYTTQYDRSCYLVNMQTQRKSRADGERTREAIVREAVSLATVDGLEGLSIGDLAGALDMSKSGVYAHFGSKQDLQLATVDEAGRIFQAEVIQPAVGAAPGLAQLVALCDAFFDHLERRTFPGGCFFAGALLEMGTRPGPVKEQIAAFQNGLSALIRGFIVTAIEQRELPADEDPDELTFEINGIILAGNASFVLRDDPAVLNTAKNVVRRRLGITKRAARSI